MTAKTGETENADLSLTVPDPLVPLALLGLLTRKNRKKKSLVCLQATADGKVFCILKQLQCTAIMLPVHIFPVFCRKVRYVLCVLDYST